MVVQSVPIESLIPDPDNRRVHNEPNLTAIEESLKRFGQVLPLVVHEGVVIGGNGTIQVMKRLGMEEANITVFEGTKDEARALAIALNRSAELAEWDLEGLGQDLLSLSEKGFMPDHLGFDESDLETMFPVEATEFEVEAESPSREVSGLGNPVIQYALIFDDEGQQKRFFEFLKYLKGQYPDEETNAARLDKLIADVTV